MEKTSMSNEDVFDRIDRELQELRESKNILIIETSILTDIVKSLKKENKNRDMMISDILLNVENRINKSQKEIETIQNKMGQILVDKNNPHSINELHAKYNKLLDFVRKEAFLNLPDNTIYAMQEAGYSRYDSHRLARKLLKEIGE